jgi:hypothetical protein
MGGKAPGLARSYFAAQPPSALAHGDPTAFARPPSTASQTSAAERTFRKEPDMAATPRTETNAATRRKLTEEMLRLGHAIDRQESGSARRLELLRQQANLSDRREVLRSGRPS